MNMCNLEQKAIELLKTYVDFEDVNGSETVEILPLTIIDYVLELFEKIKEDENYKKVLLKMEDLDSNAADITEHWQVVSWLYEKHKIWISVDVEYDKDYLAFWYSIKQISKENVEVIQSNDFSSPEEAYNAAFEYLRLNNMIL
jgi:hypothetical protein